MKRILAVPHLPQGTVKNLIIGQKAAQIISEPLLKLDIKSIILTSNTNLHPEIQDHADMIVNHIGDNRFIFADKKNLELCKVIILDSDFSLITDNLTENYPNDIALNCARVGNHLFANAKYTDKQIINHANENNIEIIDIKQGYAKCSICIVEENSIITEDISIAEQAEKHKIDVLLIKKGEIQLSNQHYGFIGGASFKINKNILAFTGNIKEHSDYNKIINFLTKRNITATSLIDKGIFDIGSAILVQEEIKDNY